MWIPFWFTMLIETAKPSHKDVRLSKLSLTSGTWINKLNTDTCIESWWHSLHRLFYMYIVPKKYAPSKPMSYAYFRTISPPKMMLWANEISRDSSWRWVSADLPIQLPLDLTADKSTLVSNNQWRHMASPCHYGLTHSIQQLGSRPVGYFHFMISISAIYACINQVYDRLSQILVCNMFSPGVMTYLTSVLLSKERLGIMLPTYIPVNQP